MPRKRSSRQAPKIALNSDSESEFDDDIDTYYKHKDKILLDNDHGDSDDTEEEEVYGLNESDSENEDIAQMEQQLRQLKRNKVKKKLESDLEDDTEDEALPDSRAWGNKKSWFMGGDVRDNKIILSGSEDEAGAAALEEKELEEVEKRRLAHMSEEDFLPPSLMMTFQESRDKKKKKLTKKDSDAGEAGESDETKGKTRKSKKKKLSVESGIDEMERIQIEADLSKGAEFERMKEMHPEYMPLSNDFGLKMRELRERIIPLMGLVKKGKMDELGATYVQMKYHIICNYLICGGFYMAFMANKTPRIHHHPVMKRLLELQQFYNRLVPLDRRVKADVNQILEDLHQGRDVGHVACEVAGQETASPATDTTRKRAARKAQREDGAEAKRRKVHFSEEEDEMEDDDDEKEPGDLDEDELERRAITYEMEKNKGLTAHRKKDLKNPRVKHRKKYRRALIRRKGQVRDYKPPKTAYGGEMTGIRSGIIRSRKLK